MPAPLSACAFAYAQEGIFQALAAIQMVEVPTKRPKLGRKR
ncbi:hypothetical protein [Candidatus Methylacidithermus pantelleriae]|uniref:Uncharacterized protein n=1 Tax=Candidatus Methylacidithermus pantelleriae TaxID=2744239 RepID=A0A8J2FWW1_9BACT|nr:hypothetical protein [Candidatus Methylacidithermus pantelleriae]CAF0701254.1 hypothetical protein MPNT_40200 [Candidatus Methylacidithermus pantelleriae]